MSTRRLLAVLFIVFGARKSLGQTTSVALVHGFDSGALTWTTMVNYLRADGRFTVPDPPTLSWGNGIDAQATQELQPFMTNNGIGASSIVVGQSMGGLVSRRATQGVSVLGVLTVGTPNFGAPIAGSGDNFAAYSGELYDLDSQIYGDFQDVRDDQGSYLYNDVRNLWDDYGYIYYFEIDAFGYWYDYLISYNYQVLHDAAPDGYPGADGYIDALNANSGLEQATQRVAMRFQLDGGYNGGPFRLVQDASTADDTGNAIVLYGNFVENDGYTILGHLSYDDDNYYEHQDGGWAAVLQGSDIADFPYWWNNDMVGGYPNDGIIPTGAQGMPGPNCANNVCNIDVPTGYMHTDETSHPLAEIKQQLLRMIGQ
jgi:hypothetical protein